MTTTVSEELLDEMAVDLACEGDLSIGLSAAEMQMAFDRLRGEGLSDNEIADTLGVERRSVQRWKSGVAAPRARLADPSKTPRNLALVSREDNTIEGMLSRAERSENKKLQKLAAIIRDEVDALIELLETDKAEAAIRTNIARLEAELAAERAKLVAPRKTHQGRASSTRVSYRDVWNWAIATGRVERKQMGCPPKPLIDAFHKAKGR